jgi:hypothetical protein
VRMNVRGFFLVALFAAVLLQAGTVDAIIVKDADSTWNTTSENIPGNITALPRIIVEYPNSVFSSDLEDTPKNIPALPRIIVVYSNSIFSSYLEDAPENISASPRIIVEYSNSIFSSYLEDTPENITASSRIIVEYSNSIFSRNFTFPKELFNDTIPPIITNVTAMNITNNSATITWNTDEIADSLVHYGNVPGSYTESEDSPLFVKNHIIELTGLSSGTTYYYVVNSTDRSGNRNESSEYYFITPVKICGDVNCNKVVDMSDVIDLLYYVGYPGHLQCATSGQRTLTAMNG